MIRLVAGVDGWVHTLIEQDARRGWAPQLDLRELVLSALPSVEPPLLYINEAGQLSTPHNEALAWARLCTCGHGDQEALNRVGGRDTAQLADLPPEVKLHLGAIAERLADAAPTTIRDHVILRLHPRGHGGQG